MPAKTRRNSFSGCFDDVLEVLKERDDEEIRAKIPRTFGARHVKSLDYCPISVAISGDQILKNIRDAIYGGYFGCTPTKDQKEIIEQILGSCLPLIYGEELTHCLDRLLRENPHWKRVKSFVAIVHARREGKTTSVALVTAAVSIFVPRAVTSIFSTGRRASRNILDQTYKFLLCYMDGDRSFTQRFNAETLWMCFGEDSDDISKINSYPAKIQITKRNKGYTERVVCLFVSPASDLFSLSLSLLYPLVLFFLSPLR